MEECRKGRSAYAWSSIFWAMIEEIASKHLGNSDDEEKEAGNDELPMG